MSILLLDKNTQGVNGHGLVGELIGIATPDRDGLMSKNSFFQDKKITADEYDNLLEPGTYSHTAYLDDTITGTGILTVLKGAGYVAHVDISNDGKLAIKTVRNTGEILKNWRVI